MLKLGYFKVVFEVGLGKNHTGMDEALSLPFHENEKIDKNSTVYKAARRELKKVFPDDYLEIKAIYEIVPFEMVQETN